MRRGGEEEGTRSTEKKREREKTEEAEKVTAVEEAFGGRGVKRARGRPGVGPTAQAQAQLAD